MFNPSKIYYEDNVKYYPLGKYLLDKFDNTPSEIIENHNNIQQLREKDNKDFPTLKQNLIIGVRKTHKYTENHKVSDFLVPYTSSGCTAMCLYCYLVCNYNKCAYLRLFVNREEMLEKIIKTAKKSEKNLTFEIGSNSDLILENTITNNLEWTINNFASTSKGNLTFPTKFDMVEPLLNLNHNEKIIIRMSVNPDEIIKKIELGTSPLKNRIIAINKLANAGYKIGLIIAPVILVENWQTLYKNLIIQLENTLCSEAKKKLFFEVIFMTYSYIHKAINTEAFPKALDLYDTEKMRNRGLGKYAYKQEYREEGEKYLKELLQRYFPKNKIIYFS